jgi:hypothetical protein
MLIVFALLIVPVTLALGVAAVDVGMWQSERRGAQKDADLAALAGVAELLAEVPDGTAAEDVATEYAGINDEAGNGSIINLVVDASCFGEGTRLDSVSIDIDHDSRTFFGDAFGISAPDIGAHARACAGSLVTTTGLRPWAMPVLGEDLGATCSAGSRDVGGDCVANCYEKNGAGEIVPSFGATCRIRSDEPQSIGSINLESDDADGDCDGGSSSAAVYAENIEEGSPAACSIGDIVSTKQGMATGPTLSSLTTLIGGEGACDSRFNSPPGGLTDLSGIDDFWEAFSPADAAPGPDTVYTPTECDDDASDLDGEPDTPRFVTVAVVTQLPLDSGTQPLEIISFAGFFIEKCERLSNTGVYVPSTPLQEAKCDLPNPKPKFQIVGRFIQYQVLGGAAGEWNPFGTFVMFLDE